MRGWWFSPAVASLALAACAEMPATSQIPIRPETPVQIRPDAPVHISPSDPPRARARELASFIERTYVRVQVWGVHVGEDIVSYAVRMRLDPRSEHPDFEDWFAHVRSAARDQRQATVHLLKLTVRQVPEARLVSVFQDTFLQPLWSRRQIVAMDEPASYREFEPFQDLVTSAEILSGATPSSG
ncbi:MAG: hypothetical protein ACRDH8_04265 [Actinomycetota bacterium]